MKKQQTGGTIIGFIVGVIVGLGAALAVAVYVTKVPVPFLNKGGSRSADMDAAESEKNRNWDPNSPLYGKNPARPAPPPAPVASAPASAPAASADARAAASAARPAVSKPEAKAESKPGADPLGDLAVAKAAARNEVDPFDYFVQAGAFRTQADAAGADAGAEATGAGGGAGGGAGRAGFLPYSGEFGSQFLFFSDSAASMSAPRVPPLLRKGTGTLVT